MTQKNKDGLRATPEVEDFGRKYTQEGQGKVGGRLIDNYFRSVANLVEHTGLTAKQKIKAIEIGCGEGHSTQRLRQLLPDNVSLQASEYVGHLVPVAQRNNPKVPITQESAYETAHKSGTFDLVFLLEVLEHLDYPDQALQELSRILKKDGWLVLGVPREPLWCALNMARGKYLKSLGNTPGHLNHWSKTGIRRYVQKHFGPIEFVESPIPWTIVAARKK
jgi:2-polyprenyl-3-methyl-5-hydroxy-6-metoxy-1,4-benzoquinol methylase